MTLKKMNVTTKVHPSTCRKTRSTNHKTIWSLRSPLASPSVVARVATFLRCIPQNSTYNLGAFLGLICVPKSQRAIMCDIEQLSRVMRKHL